MQATLWHAACGMWHLLCYSSQPIDMGRCPACACSHPVLHIVLPVIHPKPQNFSLGKNSLNFKCDWLRFALLRCRCRCSLLVNWAAPRWPLQFALISCTSPCPCPMPHAPCPMAIHDSLAAKSCCSLSFKFNSLCSLHSTTKLRDVVSSATNTQQTHTHTRTHTHTHTYIYTLSNTCVSQGRTTINYFRACG